VTANRRVRSGVPAYAWDRTIAVSLSGCTTVAATAFGPCSNRAAALARAVWRTVHQGLYKQAPELPSNATRTASLPPGLPGRRYRRSRDGARHPARALVEP
jgi:hypothetical protein